MTGEGSRHDGGKGFRRIDGVSRFQRILVRRHAAGSVHTLYIIFVYNSVQNVENHCFQGILERDGRLTGLRRDAYSMHIRCQSQFSTAKSPCAAGGQVCLPVEKGL